MRPARRSARTASAQLVERQVVEQDDVDAGGERLVELAERVDLDLDLHQVPDARRAPARSPARTPPASARWLSLISMASSRPKRWFAPPPQRTAYFSSARRPGVVLRVQTIARAGAGDAPHEVAGRGGDAARGGPRRLSAVRSPVRSARAGPCDARERRRRPSTSSPSPRPAARPRPRGSSSAEDRAPRSAGRRSRRRGAPRPARASDARPAARWLGGEVAGAAEVLGRARRSSGSYVRRG